MLQKFKGIFLFILVLIMGYMLWLDKKQIEVLKDRNESIIDSLKSEMNKRESLVDSFSVIRTSIIQQRDSSFSVIDTLGIYDLNNILRKNIYEYQNNDSGPLILMPGN